MTVIEAWHGTRARFDRFDKRFLGVATGSTNCTGFFFSTDPAVAADYALAADLWSDPFDAEDEAPALLRCLIRPDNLADYRVDGSISTRQLGLLQEKYRLAGHDVLILRRIEDSPTLLRSSDQPVVFDASRIEILERLDAEQASEILQQARSEEPVFEFELA